MKKHHFLALLLYSLVFSIIMAACYSQTQCLEESVQSPINLSPDGDIVNPNQPLELSFSYPDTCDPYKFEIYLWRDFEPAAPEDIKVVDDNHIEDTLWKFLWDQRLIPGKTYFWRTSSLLPNSVYDSPTDFEKPSTMAWFFTGPVCSSGKNMTPVNLISPQNNAALDLTESPIFLWDDPSGCLVDGVFELQISSSQDFSTIEHTFRDLRTQYPIREVDSPIDLDVCTQYYWRVLTDPNGSLEGPYSEIRSFSVNKSNVTCSSENVSPTLAKPTADTVNIPPSITPAPIIKNTDVPVQKNTATPGLDCSIYESEGRCNGISYCRWQKVLSGGGKCVLR